MAKTLKFGPIWLMQPIPYFGETIKGSWIYEPKIDGWRMQVLRNKDGKIEFWGRRLERSPNWSKKLGYLISLSKKIVPKGVLFDCELYSTGGRRFIPSLFAARPKVQPIIYVFDVIYFDNRCISDLSLEARKKILRQIKFKKPFFCLPDKVLTNIKKDHRKTVAKGHEGIVIKKLDSPYFIGKEAPIATHYWRKVK